MLECHLSAPEVVMFHRDRDKGDFDIIDDFIVARPKAKIFKKLMEEISKIIQ